MKDLFEKIVIPVAETAALVTVLVLIAPWIAWVVVGYFHWCGELMR